MDTSEMDPPAADVSSARPAATSLLSARQQIHFYSDVEWEEFVREWATTLPGTYVLIKRIGGGGDMGADVAAFKSSAGFEGPWDCFQCKHYGRALNWSDLLPELVKVFQHASQGDFVLPDVYRILAPQGVTGPLDRILSSPATMKAKFLTDAPNRMRDFDVTVRDAVLATAQADDFSRFDSTPLDDLVEAHRSTAYHSIRFGVPLPHRRARDKPPQDIGPTEARYIEQLADVYEERWPGIDRSSIATDERTKSNLVRQRFRFFEAESLMAYARDSVPPGTFKRFQDAILSGVVDVAEQDHDTGWARMTSVLTVAGQLNLQAYALVAVAEQEDLKGVCHQLANDDRIHWCQE